MSLCADCVKGVTHEGEAVGKYEEINGVKTYVALPSGEYDKTKAILFLSDIYGHQLINSRLLADDFARNGFQTYLPDYLNDDPVPADGLSPGSTFAIGPWFANHGSDKTRPPLDKVIAGLKERGVEVFGAISYCFGVRYAFDLAFDNVLKVVVGNHPSLLKVPEDLEKYASTVQAPLLLNTCTIDPQFPLESSYKADEILGDGKFAPGYSREYFEGCTHGFTVRGDLSDPKVKAGKEGAFAAAVKWFQAKL